MIRKIFIKPLESLFLGLCLLVTPGALVAQQIWNPTYSIGTVTGNYNFSYNQTPDQLTTIYPAAIPNTGVTYQWQQSTMPTTGFANISGATQTTYSIPGPLSQTMYYRLAATTTALGTVYSNVVKIKVVSVNWEDINYVREHDVLETGITASSTAWQTIDQLPIGPKQQVTDYMDGLGRSVEKVNRGVATPIQGGSTWGDMVSFSEYDVFGRQPQQYLPYTTTNQPGKYKTAPSTDQPQYYTGVFNQTSAFNTITFDNSPLKRIQNLKQSGAAWAASAGISAVYDVNTAADSVQDFYVDYTQGDAPVYVGPYAANTLYKMTSTDVNGNKVVEFTDLSGHVILRKVQVTPTPAGAHAGWICTYSVFDDMGLLRFTIQPEAVRYLVANSWSFAGTAGQQILSEMCFQYSYDAKGRLIWKKQAGSSPRNIIYDQRDRVVFMQDGNQAAMSTPQWTVNLYDELDRPTMSALYSTTESIASLQNDIASATTTSSVSISNPGVPLLNLVVDNRQSGITSYTAQNSIQFVSDAGGSFSSAAGDSFTASISSTAATPTITVTATNYNSPVSSANLTNPAVTTILKYFFYDDYSFQGAKTFNTTFTNQSAYSTSDPNVQAITPSNRTLSRATGSMVRVLGTNTFLYSTRYYDERGSIIQSQEDNIKQGTDITTTQYHFNGQVLSSCTNHSAPGTGYSNFIILTKYLFDKLGRVTDLQKQIGSNAFKTVASYAYDDFGRPITKWLDSGYTGSGNSALEVLNYTYNIHGQMTGINKDYALKNPSDYNKWGHFFGMYLGYDNTDNVFNSAQLDGQLTGQLWNTMGDDAQRRYNYSYDNAGRLVNAAFTQQEHPGDGWSNSTVDFSVTGSSGQMTYDLNSNLLSMLQKGVVPGSASPITIDNLQYAYSGSSNKLQSVTDQMTTTNVNGQFGDFKDGSNAAGTPDYVYDANGNLVVDLNKNIQSLNNGAAGTSGISYNYLDKPEHINIVGQGTLQIIYSAEGQKLQKIFTPSNGSPAITTTYINDFVYQTVVTSTGSSDSLEYINFEEGRIRVMQTNSQNNGYDALTESGNLTLLNGKMGAYDYYITDHQGNVRMVLTEETHTASNTCTMETGRASAEDPIFGQPGSGNEVEATRVATPPAWQNSNLASSVSVLGNLAGHNLGPNTLQKVMAGDQTTASVQYYYQGSASGSSPSFATTLLSSLAQVISSGTVASGMEAASSAAISSQLGNAGTFLSAIQPTNPVPTTPQAYLTILYFDERFNFISSADGGVYQSQVASSVPSTGLSLTLSGKAPKNGYVYVYISNQSDQNVYFDNLQVGNVEGNILEEDHYYAYGLKIAGISTNKLGDNAEGVLKNNFLYNYKELFDDGGLNWYDYGFRNYDPQVGRFPQLDPLTDNFPALTPFQYASGDPATNVDLDGLEGVSAVGDAVSDIPTGALATTKDVGTVFIQGVSRVTSTVSSVADAAERGFGLAFDITSIAMTTSITTSNLINSSIISLSVGDPLAQANLENNPNYVGVTLGELRGMVKNYNPALEQWMVNISAGNLLEDMYKDFSGLMKNGASSIVIGPNPDGFFPLWRTVIPDFFPGSILFGANIVYPQGGVAEVKAINAPISLSTSNYQVAGELSIAHSANAYKDGVEDPFEETAGEAKAAAITFIIPADKTVDPDLVSTATKLGVNVFVSHPYRNLKTGKIVFSTPQPLNNISNLQPYPVRGGLEGITPDVQKAAQRWRIDAAKAIDGGDDD